eukprot:TRINITY_DN5697_c0_g1_i1.p1 TRINITY_DN5697_c0_g1~~TRINITY_DN5697_c0_g1_i1.p1  ORF type:complete len:783 (+),score=46.42 TRINITY_DN5697_c0_g1_i1:22-2370(+)
MTSTDESEPQVPPEDKSAEPKLPPGCCLTAITPALKAFLVQRDAIVVYDECKHEIIVIRGNLVQVSPIYRGNNEINYTNVDAYSYQLTPDLTIMSAKRSEKGNFLACERSEKEMVFFDISRETARPCGSCALGKKKIRAFYWIDDCNILILTSTSLELWKMNLAKRAPKRVGHFNTTIDTHCYQPKKHLVVCRNHLPHKLKAFKLFKIDATGITKQQKTILDDPPKPCNTLFSFARMHNYTFLVIADSTKGEAFVYYYKTDYMDRQCTLFLQGAQPSGFSVANNLFCIHSAASQKTLLYDILLATDKPNPMPLGTPHSIQYCPRAGERQPSVQSGLLLEPDQLPSLYGSGEGIQYIMPNVILDCQSGLLFVMSLNLEALADTVDDPQTRIRLLMHRRGTKSLILSTIKTLIQTTAPLSVLASVFNTINQTYLVALKERDRERHRRSAISQAHQGRPTSPSQRSSPIRLTDSSIGDPPSPNALGNESYASTATTATTANMSNLTASTMTQSTLDGRSFVVRRGDDVDPSTAASAHHDGPTNDAFPMPDDCPVSGLIYETRIDDEWLTRNGLQVIQQLDVYKDVFFLLYEEKCCSSKYINSSFMEYVRSLSALNIPLQDFMHRFMIDMLIYSTPPDYHRLHQYLQYHVIEDHVPIALQLLKFKDQYPPSFQLAMDMLSRLRAHGEIVEVLLSCNKLVKAVEIMIQYQVKTVAPCHILEKAVSLNDDQVFYAVYQLLEKYNLEMRGTTAFAPQDRCDQYVKMFQAKFKRASASASSTSPAVSPRT